MIQKTAITFKFVEFIPPVLENMTIYISIPYTTVVHKCCCGCGKQVVTPLSPTDWKLIFDGKTISLDPSIGNWSFSCQSHYWIWNNTVLWTNRLPQEAISAIRNQDRLVKSQYYRSSAIDIHAKEEIIKEKQTMWQKILKWMSS
ncbi:DUF6527 family protein [uncultured Sporomusa sp.]|uniref:DUF6527 family protein n=1 Tax=uncultured Sporomusa sp. TaxID=307249 RepID=UPI0025902F99|nr:DUF6527 family protein [uncultured Sporomusa sp.]